MRSSRLIVIIISLQFTVSKFLLLQLLQPLHHFSLETSIFTDFMDLYE